ncbi:protein SENSITIVITY TO RED LIGHT REDUCED 1 isoform X2 [Andrographis paniculata]|uniref:protein SENSITIVITY TO RED LIGHT REDUCED 1 isoform X2 n=1 Tax=Andrographis paniculata TaxID=175694 RepID=UPI0021E7A6BF|nr:protein SENSITIVITY TO RED LIGHT REDUCED 1 isoform X2 [Andrographis paniculata]
MSTSENTQFPDNPTLAEGWNLVLPRRGKKLKMPSFRKLVPQEKQVEGQAWIPTDKETDPERESKLMKRMQSCIQKVTKHEFCRVFFDQMKSSGTLPKILKILDSEKKMTMVIYGLGSIERCEHSRIQLSLAMLLKKKFNWIGEIEVFDPKISLTELKVLTSLGCTVLTVNEQARRQVLKPTMFFMPHCDAYLYDNLLEANWRVDQLKNLILLGNSFLHYEQHVVLFRNQETPSDRKHIIAAVRFANEVRIETSNDEFYGAFSSSCWHFFNPSSEAELHLAM